MSLLLPTADAFLLDATLDAVAASARASGQERTLGQLRADALIGLCLHALRSSQHAAHFKFMYRLFGVYKRKLSEFLLRQARRYGDQQSFGQRPAVSGSKTQATTGILQY